MISSLLHHDFVAKGCFSFVVFCLSVACRNDALFGAEQPASETSPTFLQLLASEDDCKIAVLPAENMTANPDIAHYFRERLTGRVREKGYSVVDGTFLDTKLNEMGISHAGQLKLLTFAELQNLTSADAFLSGAVEEGAVQHAGFYNGYVYTCSLKLQDRNGKVLWSCPEQRFTKIKLCIDPVNCIIDIVATEVGGNMQEVAYAMADIMISNLPQGPVINIAEPSWLKSATTVHAKEL